MKGVVLAGGESRRFGQSKAFAKWHEGETLIARTHRTLSVFFDDVFISCRPEHVSNLNVDLAKKIILDDSSESKGPAAGLRAAYLHAPNETWFVMACDYPLADEACVRFLLKHHDNANSLVFSVVPNLFEPLIGIWMPNALALFLDASLSSPQLALRMSHAVAISCPDLKWLKNVNTIEDI